MEPITPHNGPGFGAEVELTVVVVSWNTQDLLRDCLRSVARRLDSMRSQVIVVDNGSCDGSPEMVASEFPSVELVSNADNLGFAAANNQGIQRARGEFVLLLNSDTVVLGDVLRASVKYARAHPRVGVLGCRVLNKDRSLQLTCSQEPTLTNLALLTSRMDCLPVPRFLGRYQMRSWLRLDERDVDVVSGCYMLVRRTAIDEVGLLDEDFFFFGEEVDWCKRFRASAWIVRFAPVGEIIHLGGGSALRLGGQRDLLLTSGLLRLHYKHSGAIAAAVVWSLLLAFNVSRMIFWFLRQHSGGGESARRRGAHFREVVRGYTSVWRRSTACGVSN